MCTFRLANVFTAAVMWCNVGYCRSQTLDSSQNDDGRTSADGFYVSYTLSDKLTTTRVLLYNKYV